MTQGHFKNKIQRIKRKKEKSEYHSKNMIKMENRKQRSTTWIFDEAKINDIKLFLK